jgi:hypothetical protein
MPSRNNRKRILGQKRKGETISQHAAVGKPRTCSALGFRKWLGKAARQFAQRFERALTLLPISPGVFCKSVSLLSAGLIAYCGCWLRGLWRPTAPTSSHSSHAFPSHFLLPQTLQAVPPHNTKRGILRLAPKKKKKARAGKTKFYIFMRPA